MFIAFRLERVFWFEVEDLLGLFGLRVASMLLQVGEVAVSMAHLW